MSNSLWLAGAVLFSVLDAYDSYKTQSLVSLVFALLWAFVAGLHFAGMVMPA